MKTFKQFLDEASTTQRLKMATLKKIGATKDNEREVYKNLLKSIIKRQGPDYPDYPGRDAARRDKKLMPSHRTSSFPELVGLSTRTKNPKKLRKQRAIGEIS